ncbi:MAG: TspO protein [Chitinophagaceae bacterium BSSC1]|nr:MAG: TspO protein [Chitinophagaceae bacterium BSSC1]
MILGMQLTSGRKLVLTILLCESVGIISGLLAGVANNPWFDALLKPSWNPPGYLFGPVWTVLYLLMGISAWLVWKSLFPINMKTKALMYFSIQLFLNFWWSILFFNFHSSLLALIDIVLMLFFICLTIFEFSKISKLAAWLLLPYLLWVSFATVLNGTIWYLNQ